MDNGPPGLSQTFARLGTQRAKVRERVDAGGVPAFESDLEGVLTDERDVFDTQLLGTQRLDPGQAAGCAGFTATFGARTSPSQLLGGVGGVVAAFPCDVHRLARAIDVDVDWKRIGVLQRSGA